MLKIFFICACTFIPIITHADSSRDYISIVGSSTVYPFSEVVAGKISKNTTIKKPRVESTGSGFGFKLFCAGIGNVYPDITNASRAIKKHEINKCARNGVKEIVEIKIGYDGIAIANDIRAVGLRLSLKDIFLALAKEVPTGNNERKFVLNPYKTWKDVNSKLPNIKIKVLGPPPTSGTRDTFEELVMEGGCKKIPLIRKIKTKEKERYKEICHTIREDGAYIESGENDNSIVEKLITNTNALGVFGFSFLDQNREKIKAMEIEGVKPNFNSISNGSYPISRPLFFYVKKAHLDITPNIQKYLKEFTSEKAIGSEGYLLKFGLIPLSEYDRNIYRDDAKFLNNMK